MILPTPGPITLTLRGQDDPELAKAKLVVVPSGAGSQPSLVVQHDPLKGSKGDREGREKMDLGKFWVKDGKLQFQWIDGPLADALMEPSHGLRDCILEVRGRGKGTLALRLRDTLRDAQPMTVEKGIRNVGWGGQYEKPSRPLIVNRCEVQVKDAWTELPAVSPLLRELVIGDSNPKLTGIDRLVLKLFLTDEEPGLHAELVPPIKVLDQKYNHANKELAATKNRLDLLRSRAIPQANDEITAAKNRQNRLKMDIQQIRSQDPKAIEIEILQGRVDDESGRIDRLNGEFRDFKGQIVELNFRRENQSKVGTALGKVKEAAKSFVKAPIRLRLKYKIEGEMFEAARIGPD